ncbi:MAG: hypothetical protein MUC50_13595 [Myxococcota bacterium]|nr:hypothetical protein [Myxococcota bacterium]
MVNRRTAANLTQSRIFFLKNIAISSDENPNHGRLVGLTPGFNPGTIDDLVRKRDGGGKRLSNLKFDRCGQYRLIEMQRIFGRRRDLASESVDEVKTIDVDSG